MPYSDLTKDEIIQCLSDANPSELDDSSIDRFPPDLLNGPARPAAVLIPFVHINGAWHILFTRRTDTLPEHGGQVAFPGGRADPDDEPPEVTALREASEEIGVEPTKTHILGRLGSFLTISNYRVTPVVACLEWPAQLRLAADEVSRVFTIPLAWLADPAHHEVRQRALPPPYAPVQVIYFQPYDGELLWGVSAQIVLNLLEILVWRQSPHKALD